MKSPAHPGELLKDDIEALGVLAAKAAHALGVSPRHLSRVMRGQKAITPEMALRLEKGLGGTAQFWLTMQTNFDIATIRRRADDLQVTSLSATQT